MLTEERHTHILNKLKKSSIIKSQDLMDELNCSESTIRRDLAQLEAVGALTRVHGGAKRSYQLDKELTVSEKTTKNVQEKQSVGRLAASLLKDNDVIYLDAGTTTFSMIEYITAKNLTVVTNGILHASALADREIQTHLIGGRLKNSTKAIVGAVSVKEIGTYRFTKAFLGMNGIDPEYGLTTPDPDEAAMKRMALQQSSITYCIADHTKLGKVNFVKVGDLEEAILLLDQSDTALDPYREKTTILEAAK